MAQDLEIMKSTLGTYPFINYYLGNIIEQRLKVEGYECGVLTAQLLNGESSKEDLERLENALKLGRKEGCTNFTYIFRERRLPNKKQDIDSEIINILAEVKAFEFLHIYGFLGIVKIKSEEYTRTVDFTAKRSGYEYAIEVTRLGLSQTFRKKPKHIAEDKLVRYPIPENDKQFGEYVGEWFITSGKDNIPRIVETIYDTVNSKHCQIKEFCQIHDATTKGILFISSGRDYFVMNKYAKTEFEMHVNAVREATKEVWRLFSEEHADYACLQNIVITIGKELDKIIIYPELLK